MSMLLERSDVRTFVEDLPAAPSGPGARLVPIEFGTEKSPTRSWSEAEGEEVSFDLAVSIRGRGKLAHLHLRADRRYRDGSAVLVVARTADSLAEFRIEIDESRSRPFNFHMSTVDLEGTDPEVAWPILEFLALLKSPNEFSLVLPGDKPIWTPLPHADAPGGRTLATLMLQLRTVARHTRAPVRVPGYFSQDLSRSLAVAAQLLAGGVVPGRWKSAEIVVPPTWDAEWTPDRQFAMDLPTPLEFMVGPTKVVVDRWARLYKVRFGKPKPHVSPGERVVRLEPDGDDRVEYRRGPWLTREAQQKTAASVVEGDWVAMLGDAVIGWNAQLPDLIAELSAAELRPDKIVRAVPSDLPAMP